MAARVYDLVMTHKLDADDLFIHQVQFHCARLGLSFFLVEPLWVERFYELYTRKEVGARVLLNMHSEHHLPDDIYHRLILFAHHQGAKIIDPPDIAQAAFDKARMHERLVASDFTVPYTVTVPQNAAATFRLTAEQKERLGEPFVIKPSHGYGRRGVLLDARGEHDLPRSVAAWPNPEYLLQRMVLPSRFGERPAYWRVFHIFGDVRICWWNCFNDEYFEVTETDGTLVPVAELEEIVRQISQLTGMQFFSSEVAQIESGELVLIDYVNDQCHMLSQSSDPRMGVPDDVVRAVARRLVTAAVEMIRSTPASP